MNSIKSHTETHLLCRAKVVVLAPMKAALDYSLPNDTLLKVGDHVWVPLGSQRLRGIISEICLESESLEFELKSIISRIDDPSVPENSLKAWLWAASWTLTPPGTFLKGCLQALKANKAQTRFGFVATDLPKDKLKPKQLSLIEAAVFPLSSYDLSKVSGVSVGMIKTLERKGHLERVELFAPRFSVPDADYCPAKLNPSQSAAFLLLKQEWDDGGFKPVLLDGVTGSGKTEVYLEMVAQALKSDPNAQVLILLPEIALTTAVMSRLTARFGTPPVQWHSGLAAGLRRHIWEGVAKGEARLIVGARSALFLPFSNLRLIIIDEEHDASYKQEEGVRYQARDLAVMRAHSDAIMVIMASATPSLETLTHAQKGRYGWVRLEARHGLAQLPDIRLIDLKTEPPDKGFWLSNPLMEAIHETLARKEQVLLFLNRRGYAPLVICRACGERMTSPNTDSWLVEHRASQRLVCHLTGFSMKKPDRCPHCGAKDSLMGVGPGVERILEEVSERFPLARAEIFSSDTAPDALSSAKVIGRVEANEIDILIATQAAAKGHNFLNLTLVGIVDADLGLKGGDLRASERTFQLLAQATGRAGRAEKSGRALIQTYTPEHPVMQALQAGDREAFYAYEQTSRELAQFPPFGRLAALILSGKDKGALSRFAKSLAEYVPNTDGIEVYGPADAPLSLVRGMWRMRFLVRANRNRDIQGFISVWLKGLKPSSAIRVVVDIDPYSFL